MIARDTVTEVQTAPQKDQSFADLADIEADKSYYTVIGNQFGHPTYSDPRLVGSEENHLMIDRP